MTVHGRPAKIVDVLSTQLFILYCDTGEYTFIFTANKSEYKL